MPMPELRGTGNLANPDRGHVEAQLTREQTLALNRLFVGLDAGSYRLKATTSHPNGRRVQSKADAVRWLLEQIGE